MTNINTTLLSFTSITASTTNQSRTENDTAGFESILNRAGQNLPAKDAALPTDADSLMNYMQQMIMSTENFLTAIGTNQKAAAITPVSNPFAADDGEGFITGDGPLPKFLAEVDRAYGLDPSQQKALRDIALAHRDATRDPATIQQIADELAKAGIGVPQANA